MAPSRSDALNVDVIGEDTGSRIGISPGRRLEHRLDREEVDVPMHMVPAHVVMSLEVQDHASARSQNILDLPVWG